METFNHFELIWLSVTTTYVLKAIYDHVIAGTQSCDADFSGYSGFFRFKKRPVIRWLVGICTNSLIVYAVYRCYITNVPASNWIVSTLDRYGSPNRTSTDCMSTLIASMMLLTHLMRRGHTAIFRSIYSDSTQSWLNALAPVLYNLTAGFVLLSVAPPVNVAPPDWFHLSSLKLTHVLGVAVFGLSCYLDKACQEALRQSRRNRAGHVVTDDHKVPQGGLFDLVTSPHFFLEIVTHVAVGLTLGADHRPWWILTGYVVASHVIRAIDRHRWFRQKFPKYPSERKIIVPYLF